jgi:DNA mismatch endonuclease (patch repair protein)
LFVRGYLHAHGLRFRLHDKRLPGAPDICLPKRASVVFVNGCFWHGHDCRHGAVVARRNAEYWAAKIEDNRRRDRCKHRELRALGWHVEVVWECECCQSGKLGALARRLLRR